MQDLDEAIEFVSERPEPLAVYLFSSDEALKRHGTHMSVVCPIHHCVDNTVKSKIIHSVAL